MSQSNQLCPSAAYDALVDSGHTIRLIDAVIAEYRRQHAESGLVDVPVEFLVTMRNITQNYPPDGSIEQVTDVLTNLIAHHDDILAGVTEQDR